MKTGAVNLMWMPSVKSKPRMLTCSPMVAYVFLTIVVGSWVSLAISGYLFYKLHGDYSKIKQEHAVLTQKADQLDAVLKKVEVLKKDEVIIRDFLGLEKAPVSESFMGQGGVPYVDLSSIAPEDTQSRDVTSQSRPPGKRHIVAEVTTVADSYSKIVGYMREQRLSWEHTPSIIPVEADKYWISSGFGWRINPFTGKKGFHNGIDIAGRPGTPIISPAQGRVIKVGQDKYLGKFVQIDHTGDCISIYGHLSGFNVKKGDKVSRGDVVAFMGNTGLSTGTHLHYIVKIADRAVNPRRFMLNVDVSNLLDG